MRKFFKSLAVLLALTLIVGVIPASAAVNLTMDSEKTLYIGGSKGAKEDGAKCKISYKKKVANMIKNFDSDTMIVALKSADESIVSTTKSGRIVAESLGTTTVTVTVFGSDEDQLFQQDLKVKVKKNATSVKVEGIANGDRFNVGETVDVSLPRVGVDTDERDLISDNTEIATVEAGAKSRTYKVKFIKSGEVTLTAKAYQSAKYPAATATEAIKVTVGNPIPSSVKVVASNAYELTFDANVADIFKSNKDIADDAVYYLSNDVKIPFTGIKEVKTTENVVKVTMFNNFSAGVTYYVVVNGSDPLNFSIAGNQAKDVTAIVINTATLQKDKDTDVSVSLLNADGVDITSSVGTTDVALTSSDNLKLWPQGGLKATMYNVGDTADLTATFTYYDPNNNYEATVIKVTKSITCVAQPVAQKTGKVYTIGGSQNNPKSYMAVNDPALVFQCWLKETLNGTTLDRKVGKDNFANLGATYAKIADTSIAMITADDTQGNYSVKANQVGSTYVFICYTDAAGKEQILDSCPIEVRAARFAQNVALSLNKSNLNYSVGADEVVITAKITDNYQDPIDTVAPTWTQLEASKAKGTLNTANTFLPVAGKAGTYELKVKAADFTAYTADGAIVVTVQAGDKSNKPNATFNVAKKGTSASGYNFTIDKSSIDTSINALKTGITKATVSLTAVKDGYFVDNQSYDQILNGAAAPNNNTAASYGAFTLDIKKDGKQLDLNSNVPNTGIKYSDLIKINGGKIEISTYFAGTTGAPATDGAITKLPTGNYAFELYIIKGGKVDGSVRRATLTVSDKQVKPTFKKVEQSVTKAGSEAACFEFSFDGKKQTNINTAPYVTKNLAKDNVTVTSVFVAKAAVTLDITDGNGVATGKYTITVDVNTLLDP